MGHLCLLARRDEDGMPWITFHILADMTYPAKIAGSCRGVDIVLASIQLDGRKKASVRQPCLASRSGSSQFIPRLAFPCFEGNEAGNCSLTDHEPFGELPALWGVCTAPFLSLDVRALEDGRSSLPSTSVLARLFYCPWYGER